MVCLTYKLIYLYLLPACIGSLFDPHVFPETGPFFEGWYLRITDFTNTDSLGFLFGSVLPRENTNSSAPLVVVSILRQRCSGSGVCKLTSVDGKFKPEQLNITADGGKPVAKNPDRMSPSNFRWEVVNQSNGCYFKQDGNQTTWAIRIDDMLFRGAADMPQPWDSSGSGPEGYLSYLPLPLHWFVFSLKSRLIKYDIENTTSGEVLSSQNGVVHMEKNWGESFPRSWIWSEGVTSNKSNASYALSGGIVDFHFLSVPAYLIGYRNPSTGVNLNFRPDNSVVDTKIDGCHGIVNMTITSFFYSVNIEIVGHSTSFSSCLLGPEAGGFTRACVESYNSTAYFRIYKRNSFIFSNYVLMEEQSFKSIALEFGGLNVCNHTCTSDTLE